MGVRLTGGALRLVLGVAVLGLVAGACGSSQPATSNEGTGAAPTASAALGASSSPSASQPASLDEAEASLRQDNRNRAGLANLGSGAVELAGLMDASGFQALQDELPRIDAAIGGTASAAPTAHFASEVTPGSVIFAPWEFTTTYFERLQENGVGNRILDDRDTLPNCIPGDGTCTGKEEPHLPPGQESGSETYDGEPATVPVTIGGNPGSITSTSTATVAFNGSKVSIDLEIRLQGEIHDASGATIMRIESSGKGHIDGDACPDASGIARAHIAFSASESYFGSGVAGSAYGLREDFSADVRIHADDQANLAGIEVVAKAHETSQGGVPAAGGSSDLTAHDYDAGFTRTLGYDPKGGFGPATTTNESASSVESTSLYLGMALFTELPAKLAAKAAEKAWRSGMCVRVTPAPKGGDVAKDSKTEVRVIVRQRYEDVEINKPVVATLDSGPKSIDPAGQPKPAPATFTYTAGPKDKDIGVVTFESVSNRGIGKTSVYFAVGGGWNADKHDGELTITGQKCNGLDGVWKLMTKIKNPQVDQTATYVVTINGTTGVGTYTINSLTVSDPGLVTTIVGNGRAGIAMQPDGTLKMTIFGTTVIGTSGPAQVSIPIPDTFFTWTSGGTCP